MFAYDLFIFDISLYIFFGERKSRLFCTAHASLHFLRYAAATAEGTTKERPSFQIVLTKHRKICHFDTRLIRFHLLTFRLFSQHEKSYLDDPFSPYNQYN